MINVGTVDGGIVSNPSFHTPAAPIQITDSAIASGGAFLTAELEKRDNLVRKPLTSFTYARDIPITVGGGWVEAISSMNVSYGVTGGSGDGLVHASSANGVPIVQANLDKDLYKSHIFSLAMRISFVDLQRSNQIGRSLDQLLTDGVRMAYDKHIESNVYIGLPDYGTTGLLNNPNVVATNVASLGSNGTSSWKSKSPQQILDDVNTALTEVWAAAEYDRSAIPNHILLPYDQFLYISTAQITNLAEKTILKFLKENNVSSQNGTELFIGGTNWCKGAGVGSTDRMVVYVNHERFLKMEELVPLGRIMTQPNATGLCYDSAYMANLSEVEIFYPQTLRYYDGI